MERTVIVIEGVEYNIFDAGSLCDETQRCVMSQYAKKLERKLMYSKMKDEKESKYYTPKIEEFYVGFECQIFNAYSKWQSLPVELSHLTLDEVDGSNNWRVKFLDKLDVESLGFNYEGTNQDSNPVFLMMKELSGVNNLQNVFMTFDKANNTVDIKIVNITDLISYENSTNTMTFKAKNKSELKRILESLNIL